MLHQNLPRINAKIAVLSNQLQILFVSNVSKGTFPWDHPRYLYRIAYTEQDIQLVLKKNLNEAITLTILLHQKLKNNLRHQKLRLNITDLPYIFPQISKRVCLINLFVVCRGMVYAFMLSFLNFSYPFVRFIINGKYKILSYCIRQRYAFS